MASLGGVLDKRTTVWIPTQETSHRWHLWCPPPAAADAALKELSKFRAARAMLSKGLQEDINRWKTVEKAKNKRANFIMRQLYSEAVLYAGDLALLVCLVKMLQSWSDSARDGWHTDNTSLVGSWYHRDYWGGFSVCDILFWKWWFFEITVEPGSLGWERHC